MSASIRSKIFTIDQYQCVSQIFVLDLMYPISNMQYDIGHIYPNNTPAITNSNTINH